jgi:hypothetical protein
MRDKNLSILTAAEKRALYDLPDFDEFQRAEFFSFTTEELAVALRRDEVSAQLLCLLQLGYFKAKQSFFTFSLLEVLQEDLDFLMERYLPGKVFYPRTMRPAEHYAQRKEIVKLFGYRQWAEEKLSKKRRKCRSSSCVTTYSSSSCHTASEPRSSALTTPLIGRVIFLLNRSAICIAYSC